MSLRTSNYRIRKYRAEDRARVRTIWTASMVIS
jgi:hypothetical protein